jgi:F0F1-type ATP synthase assembly protein I
MIAVILVFTYAGIYLDKRFDTKPWLMLVFTLSGIFGSIYQLIRKLTSEDKK